MRTISRRKFFKKTTTDAALAGILSATAGKLAANPLGLPIGCQTWPVRDMGLRKTFPAP